MTVDRETRDLLAELARRVPSSTFKASVITDSPSSEAVLVSPPALWDFIAAATPEVVLALLADLDTAERRAEKLADALSGALHFYNGNADAGTVTKWMAALAEHGDVS